MTQYNDVIVKCSNSQLNKLKSAIQIETELVLRQSSNMIGNSDDENNFPHKLLLTNRQVASLRKVFASYLSVDIKLSKTQLPIIVQLGGFIGRLLGSLLKTDLPLMGNVIQPLAKGVLIQLGLIAAESAADAGVHKNILGSGTATLIISKDGMEEIMKIVKSIEDSGLLLKGGNETIQNEAKGQKAGFLSMLLGTLGASLLRNMLAGKRINRAGDGMIRAGYGSKGSSTKRSSKNKTF